MDRRDEYVHLAVERFHLLAELAHHLASDLVNLLAEFEDFVIDLLVYLVELVRDLVNLLRLPSTRILSSTLPVWTAKQQGGAGVNGEGGAEGAA